ncbi:MAG TPA: hypothetical protein VG293_10095 [Solirubrobacteraceae bacterium]|nr:hypothetical protein [Solirubrobacteraceae bacterium]
MVGAEADLIDIEGLGTVDVGHRDLNHGSHRKMPPRSKNALIDELIQEFRATANQDDAFDAVASTRLGVSDTDMRCLNIIEDQVWDHCR